MRSKILPVLAFVALAFQASVGFAQQDDSNDNHGGDQTSGGVWVIENVTTYETVCHDEVKTTTVNTGQVTCDVTNNSVAKSADFAGSGHCEPIMDTVETMIPVCKQVPKVTQVWVQKEQSTGQIGSGGEDNRGGQDPGYGAVE